MTELIPDIVLDHKVLLNYLPAMASNDLQVTTTEGELVNARGQRLHTLSHCPEPQNSAKAALIFHHGYGEHSGRYLFVFELLARAGIACFSYDAHGHGLSDPKEAYDRVLVWSFSDLVDDLQQYAAMVKEQLPSSLPLFLGGHSMGALTSVHLALREQNTWHGLICCSGSIDVERNLIMRLQTPLAGLLAALVPRARIVPAVKGEDMSSDPEAIRTMEEDPLNSQGNVRARTANEMLKAFGHVAQQEGQLVLPIYAHHGGEDRLANLRAVRRMLDNCSSPDTTLYVVPNGYHEVLMGTERTDCTNRIAAWILGHLEKWSPPEPSAEADEAQTGAGQQLNGGLQSPSSSSDLSSVPDQSQAPAQPQTGISGAELKQLGTMESGGVEAHKPLEPLSAAACQVSGSA